MRCYLDIAIGYRDVGRVTFQLFNDQLPYTAENFRALCTGETGLGYWLNPRWYRHSPIHRVIPGFMMQGGDFNLQDGRMGESIYGQRMRDERFLYQHDRRGLLSMAHGGQRHTGNSQFFITFGPQHHLDKKHVVFGQVESGWEVLDEVEKVGSEGGKPRRDVRVHDCGELIRQNRFKRREAGAVDDFDWNNPHENTEEIPTLERPATIDLPDPYCPVPAELFRRAGHGHRNNLL
jgi:peptidylprolyl isomerase